MGAAWTANQVGNDRDRCRGSTACGVSSDSARQVPQSCGIPSYDGTQGDSLGSGGTRGGGRGRLGQPALPTNGKARKKCAILPNEPTDFVSGNSIYQSAIQWVT